MKVSISSISFTHFIVFVSLSYIPPAKLHFSSSIPVPSGSFAVISILTFPL